ncbi:type IV secretion system protein (plasmid) [Moraxella lincolnii]|uniref:type IV secretion system protein n=1 Tax=Lwoffella lincolnii TaxID=90241 RepID=UPI0030D5CDF1
MKTVNFSKQAITSIMSLALLAPITMPSQAGVPVIDVSAIAQAIVQVNNQISQIKQLDQQIKAITDNGNYADLLNNPLVRKELNKYLPKGYNDIFEAARAGDLGALEQVAKAAAERERQAQTTQTGIERQKSVALLTQAQMTQMMQGMDVRSQRLQSLVNRINTTTNMAQKQDLMNTISAETAMINLEMNKMLVLMKQAEHQEKLANRQAGREYAKKAFQ